MNTDERIRQIADNMILTQADRQWGEAWPKADRSFDVKKLQDLIWHHRHRKPYEWYLKDLKRKRPNRKQGRDLYKGILAYRRRVGQPEQSRGGLSFRGVARIYDLLRIKTIRMYPEMASKLPDLYTRFLYVRFPVDGFRQQYLGYPKTSKTIDLSRYGLRDCMSVKLSGDIKSLIVSPVIGGVAESFSEAGQSASDASDAMLCLAESTARLKE